MRICCFVWVGRLSAQRCVQAPRRAELERVIYMCEWHDLCLRADDVLFFFSRTSLLLLHYYFAMGARFPRGPGFCGRHMLCAPPRAEAAFRVALCEGSRQ